MKVRKAVITAAGMGTRFLPTSKCVPKELLPVLDKPLIQRAVEEVVAAGVDQVIIVTSPGKPALEAHFRPAPDLEEALKRSNSPVAAEVAGLSCLSRFSFVVQEEPLGLGDAVLMAADAVGNEPFLLVLPDDLVYYQRSGSQQMVDVFQRFEASVVAVEAVSREAVNQYGVIDGTEVVDGVLRLTGLVEKPEPQDAPSNLAIVGRYILTPQIFGCLRGTAPGAKGEIQLTDAISLLLKEQPVYACRLQGERHDGGTPLGLLKASLEEALRRDEYREAILEFLEQRLPGISGGDRS